MKRATLSERTPLPGFTPLSSRALQRKCACGDHTTSGGERCPSKGGMLQRRAAALGEDRLEREANSVAMQGLAAPAGERGVRPEFEWFASSLVLTNTLRRRQGATYATR
jgi:hypothetical protein